MDDKQGQVNFKRAEFLVNTSVDDLQSSLEHYEANEDDIAVIRLGLKWCERRGEKTKALLLRRKLKKLEKEAKDG
ncbi:MAG: hypothetical protein C4583_04250 [Anaerolineaceae bacterium]|nr:MAG: hypothetical protein C4583_04250 [Anaerolineaceae bacterium]